MFVSTAERYEFNLAESAGYAAAPAKLSTPTGEKEPAVLIRNAARIKTVMPVSEALRLANQIADAVEAHRDTTGSSQK